MISLAPKITIAKIFSKLNQAKNIARLIPNATSFINEGYNPVCFSSDFTSKEKQQILDLLKVMGNTFEVSEEKLESYAIMSAMLPTYFWFQWKELSEIGQKIGSDRKGEQRFDKRYLDCFIKPDVQIRSDSTGSNGSYSC